MGSFGFFSHNLTAPLYAIRIYGWMFCWWYCSIDMMSPTYTVECSNQDSVIVWCFQYVIYINCDVKGVYWDRHYFIFALAPIEPFWPTTLNISLLSKVHVLTLLLLVEITQDLLFRCLSNFRGLTRRCLKIHEENDPTKLNFFWSTFSLVFFRMYTFYG